MKRKTSASPLDTTADNAATLAQPGRRTAMKTALLGATPFMTKIAAVGIMGKPAYDLFKRTVLKSLRVRAVL